ncbi:hypothetical protein K8S19_09330 [bacterium]|nr:hypothetical protein [bacterium]
MDIRKLATKFLAKEILFQKEFENLFNFIHDRLPAWMRPYYADAFQIVALRLMSKTVQMPLRDSMAYLMTAVKNECVNQKRLEEKHAGLPERDVPDVWCEEEKTEMSVIDRLHENLAELQEKDLQLLAQVYWLAGSRRKISNYLDISLNTLRQRLFRVVAGLRLSMAQ